MDGMEWADYIIKLASVMGAIGVLGNFLIKVYKKYVTDPDQKMAEKIQKESSESLKEAVAPLTKSIDLLNHLLEESQSDRKQIHLELDMHEERLDIHDSRILSLEDWRKGEVKDETEK